MKFHIPTPCPEDWGKMKIGLTSRFCESCTKDVMDFTKMSRQEILEYLLENQGHRTCGRILPSQLDFTRRDIVVTLHQMKKRFPRHQLPMAVMFIAGMMLAGCDGTGERRVTKATEVTEDKQRVTDDTEKVDKKDKNIVEKKINYTPEHEIELQGEVAYHPEIYDSINRITQKNKIFDFVEEDAEFPGGSEKLTAYIAKNFNQLVVNEKVKGKVFVVFVVEKDGSISNVKIMRGLSPEVNSETIRVIESLPSFKTPGKNKGKAVRSRFMLPILIE